MRRVGTEALNEPESLSGGKTRLGGRISLEDVFLFRCLWYKQSAMKTVDGTKSSKMIPLSVKPQKEPLFFEFSNSHS